MITYYAGCDAVVLELEKEERGNTLMLVRRCLMDHGLSPWEKIESEVFRLNGTELLIARPQGPKLCRLNGKTPRLRRLQER